MEKQQQPVTVFVIGCGSRGKNYIKYALEYPQFMQVNAIAEPRKQIQQKMKDTYKLQSEQVFDDWKDSLKLGKIADAAIIALQDKYHKECAIALAKLGYQLILEKPMAVTKEDCQAISNECDQNKVQLIVCHVLRYAPWNSKIKQLLDNNAIGEIVNIQHYEPVGYWHFAHSYVRGNWRNESESSFSLMTKSCHDLDLISWWMNRKCEAISCFGSLYHFKKENKPKEAILPNQPTTRCLECPIESKCPYSAKIYLRMVQNNHLGWPVSILSTDPDIENITQALKEGPYGRCVYDCDNDVCDNYVVNFQFEGGATATFTQSAFTEKICERKTYITGTKGEILLQGTTVRLFQFVNDKVEIFQIPQLPKTELTGHDGSDFYFMDAAIKALYYKDPSLIRTNAQDTLNSHLLVFAAEESRKKKQIINF